MLVLASQRLVDKILAGDYMNVNELPPAQGISKPFTIEDEMVLSQRPIADFALGLSALCSTLYTTHSSDIPFPK